MHVARPTTPGPSVRDFLSLRPGSTVRPAPHLRGFGGLHGGLAVAAIVASMQRSTDDRPLVAVTAHFHRPLREPFTIHTTVLRDGTTIAIEAIADAGAERLVTAHGLFGPSAPPRGPAPLAPLAPEAPSPDSCDVFHIPREFVPIADQTEIRPVGPNRPFAGGSEPELTAWVRIVEDDRPPDLLRLIFLLDALAPSYAAIVRRPVPIPTIELTIRPGNGIRTASGPWLLLAARTDTATRSGWVDETIDAWDEGGRHLGSARQLRLVKPSSG